uniref:Uncharacterized protein n=1 Tax=Cucumis melo TaxID=3656 RepID=A0A9I9E0N9_CUCME
MEMQRWQSELRGQTSVGADTVCLLQIRTLRRKGDGKGGAARGMVTNDEQELDEELR